MLELLPDTLLVVCEGCGLEQVTRPWPLLGDDLADGCFLCGHLYARMSPQHEEAMASVRARCLVS